ncbi:MULTISPECIES: hypothetical protein [Bacillus]|uniref:Uncharacterized protein n=2 Tax=Bacillus TaxID=1386 RepID=A0ABT9DL67_9BACI|nr:MULTISPECIES: hypothetical protein [Bacillus]MCY9376408.1 hypothetical protein [Bacillus sp. T17B1]RPK05022.1 hypothetical protein BSBH6_01723 [Bacillus subtilis]MBU2657905.1 hypothetical protein [Bacillus cabrialesii]MBY4604312.1 hypothetical protein [Bacillus sp. SPARC3]MDO3662088.1 hypothetical protein [Bacillus sp. C28GYM-DRY-1]
MTLVIFKGRVGMYKGVFYLFFVVVFLIAFVFSNFKDSLIVHF